MTKTSIQLLLIEDSETDALLLEEALRQDALNTFEFSFAERLETGLEILDSHEFDLVLLDLGLPDSRGLKTFEKLHQVIPDMPVVVLSGLADEKLALEAVQAGAQDYLVKGPTSWEIAPRAIRYAIERKRAEERLRVSEERYRHLVENMTDVVMEVDAAGNYSYISPNYATLSGYSLEEEVGSSALKHVHPDDLPLLLQKLEKALGSERQSMIYRVQVKNGEWRWIETSGKPYRAADGSPHVISVARDVTERKRVEEAIRNRNRMLLANYKVMLEIGAELRLPILLSSILEQAQSLLDADRGGGVYLKDTDEDILKLACGSGINQGREGIMIQMGEGVAGRVYETSQALIVDDYTHWEGHATILVADPPSTVMGVPLFLKGEVIGVLTLIADSSIHKFTDQDVQQAEMFAAQTAVAIQYARLYQQAQQEITERKQAETSLSESLTRFRTLFEASPEALLILDPQDNWSIQDCNIAACEMNGYTRDELIGQSIDIINLQPGGAVERQQYLDQIKNAGVLRMESYHRRKDGSEFPVEIATCMLTLDGRQFVLGIDRDITERRQAEELLRESEKRYRTTLNNMMEGCQIIDHDWRYIYINDTAAMQGRRTSEELLMHTMMEMYPGIENTALFETLRHCMQTKTSRRIENEFKFADGSSGWFELSIQPVPEGLFILSIDITERKKAEESLRASEERFATVFHASPMSIALTRLQDNRLIDVNEAWQRLTGFSQEKALGRDASVLNVWADPNQRDQLLTQLRNDGTVQDFEFQMRKKSGEISDLLFSAVTIEVAGEDCMLSMALDITDRKRAEEALLESEQRFRSLYNNATVGLYRTTPDGRILMSNPAAVRLLGFDSFEELVERNLEQEGFEPDYSRREFRETLERTGTVVGLESAWTKKDGTSIFVRESATVVRDNQGKVIYYDGTFEDITERKHAEEQVRAAQQFSQGTIDALSAHICVLDENGVIVSVNRAWCEFAEANPPLLDDYGLGMNYLHVCEQASGKDSKGALEFAEGIRSVMEQETEEFVMEYPCHAPGKQRWFSGRVTRFEAAGPLRLAVSHVDITKRILAEQALRHHLAELETLYESGLSLNQLLEPKAIAQNLIDVLVEKLKWNHTTIRLYHPESNSLELLAYSIAQKTTKKQLLELEVRFKTLITQPGEGFSGWAFQHSETVRCGDVAHDPRYIEMIPGLRSGLYVPIKTGEQTIGVISIESEEPDYFTAEDENLAVTLAAQAAVALENNRLFNDLRKSNDDLFRAYDETIEGWSQALDLRDKETEGHTQRVTALTEELARAMDISEADLVHVRRGALLHDIGKMGVPDRILLKPDKLTDEEWVIMREHPVHAYNLLSHIEFLRPALNIPHYHHERWDGSGYPAGLKGKKIPLEARIFAIIDVYDALISDRPYRPGWPKDKALSYIREQSGSHFDPKVVDTFLKLIAEE